MAWWPGTHGPSAKGRMNKGCRQRKPYAHEARTAHIGKGRCRGCVNAATVLHLQTGTAHGSKGRCRGYANATVVQQGCPRHVSQGMKILILMAGRWAFVKMRGEHCERGGARGKRWALLICGQHVQFVSTIRKLLLTN